MMQTVGPHLTEEQFSECALSAPVGAAKAHLESCVPCREELQLFEAAMSDFGRATAAWSQSMPMASLRPLLKQRERRNTVRVAWAFAMALVVAVGLPFATQHRAGASHEAQVAAMTQQDSAAQIAQDNKLMQQVYVALTPDDSSSVRAYGVETSVTRSRTRTGLKNQ